MTMTYQIRFLTLWDLLPLLQANSFSCMLMSAMLCRIRASILQPASSIVVFVIADDQFGPSQSPF